MSNADLERAIEAAWEAGLLADAGLWEGVRGRPVEGGGVSHLPHPIPPSPTIPQFRI